METSPYRGHRLFLEKKTVAVPPSPTDAYASEATSFDTNMVLVIALLLCALICSLALNSLVRLALRCGYRVSSNSADSNQEQVTGLKKKTLTQIPEMKYELSGLNVTDCPICLGEFAEGENVRMLPKCKHGFHVKCIDKWLYSHSTCPLCRQPLADELSTVCCGSTEDREVHVRVRIPGLPEFRTGG
ncbi:RING-H2 finger protein ATL74-like [Mercurialis annua]|uniref:RING-H2 finger protein ATL74-like n=1 Tax=Mercurialis annua TaxID=3986 RepID=UPI00215DF69C|nr:RING-H2 finger protein ATL74-like [Mercurialis annua]